MRDLNVSEVLFPVTPHFDVIQKMKKSISIIILLIGGINLFGESKEDSFKSAYKEAIAKSDEALFALVEFSPKGNPMFDKMMKESLMEDRKKKIKTMRFGDIPNDAILEFHYEGFDYIPTLPIVKEFIVEYDTTNDDSGITDSRYRLGLKNGEYKIVSSMKK